MAASQRLALYLDNNADLDSSSSSSDSNGGPYGVNSPFSLPPYESLAPIPLPENGPPFCVYPPFTPLPPFTAVPTPLIGGGPPTQSPPESISSPNSPEIFPGPPGIIIPNPPEIVPSPPGIIIPNPPGIVPAPPAIILSPPEFLPSPPVYTPIPPPYYEPSPPSGSVPSPPVFQPPVVFPPPTVPPPPLVAPATAFWCVAKPSVPEPIILEAMNYACGSGADCDQIQPSGSCFEPNTLLAHASYAFNSYWQRTKVAGGTCEFGGTAMLVTVDPSYDGCHFINY